jgi:hypothetical protein
MYTLLLTIMPRGVASFSLVCFFLAPIVFFAGTIAYNILMGMDNQRKTASFVQLGTGFLSTVLFGIAAHALFTSSGSVASLIENGLAGDPDHAQFYANAFVTFAYFGQMIIFGLMPLLKGINKVFVENPEGDYCEECQRPSGTPNIVVIPTPAFDGVGADKGVATVQAVKPKRTTTAARKPKLTEAIAQDIQPVEIPTVQPQVDVEISQVDADNSGRKPRHR